MDKARKVAKKRFQPSFKLPLPYLCIGAAHVDVTTKASHRCNIELLEKRTKKCPRERAKYVEQLNLYARVRHDTADRSDRFLYKIAVVCVATGCIEYFEWGPHDVAH